MNFFFKQIIIVQKSEFQQFKIVQDISQLPLKVKKQQERRKIISERGAAHYLQPFPMCLAVHIRLKTKKKVYREKGAKVCNNLKRLSMEKLHKHE